MSKGDEVLSKPDIADLESENKVPNSPVEDVAANPQELASSCVLVAAESEFLEENINFEKKSPEEKREYIQKLITDFEFFDTYPIIQKLFLKATKSLDTTMHSVLPDSRWGLRTIEAERCLNDIVRTEKFRQSLKEIIKQGNTMVEANVNTGDTVVEAGAGTGILAMMGAAMGARKVYALEINPSTVKTCRAFLEYCGFDSSIIEVIETDATSCDLPEQVDVIVSENMSTGLFAEPQMQIMNNLKRFLKPGGKIIPEKFKSSIELVRADGLEAKSAVRNEAGIDTKISSTKAEFDVVRFALNEETRRVSSVVVRATQDARINAVNVSSTIGLTDRIQIESNTCRFLGQDEVVKLDEPVDLRAGELYEISLDYEAGARPEDLHLSVVPAKKLRLDQAVSHDVRQSEEAVGAEVEEKIIRIESRVEDLEFNFDPDEVLGVISELQTTIDMIKEAKRAGYCELYRLTQFYQEIEELYSRIKKLPVNQESEAKNLLDCVEADINREKKNREIEDIFYDSIEAIHRLNPDNKDVNLEAIRDEIPLCLEKLKRCAEALFDFKIGGIFRIDEFYSYVEKLRSYNLALRKIIVGQGLEVSGELEKIMSDLEEELNKHAENLAGVPELLEGRADIMSFDEYNKLAIEMTSLYVEYLQVREGNSEAIVNKKEAHASLDKYVACSTATAKDGRRFMLEFKGKRGCEFGRCANCCFATAGATHEKVTPANISNQLNAALVDSALVVAEDGGLVPKWKEQEKSNIYKIDILTPGSFLNDNEMPKESRTEIFRQLAKLPFKTIMFESRIEYIDEKELQRLRSILRPDQKMQVAIGLESANSLVREVAINKGYTLSDFERAVEILMKNDIDVQVYSILKPALLTEKQAVQDAVNTGRYLAELSEKIKSKIGNTENEITLKIEQAFIQDGGFLDFLHKRGKYKTPWTMSTAEVVKQLCLEGIDKKINIQIGTDSDYPPPETVTQNRRPDGSTCPSTLLLNKALQAYNFDHDFELLSVEIEKIKLGYPETAEAWREVIGETADLPNLVDFNNIVNNPR